MSTPDTIEFLCGFDPPEDEYITIDQNPPCTTPTVYGTIEDFGQKYGINVMNDSKKCLSCYKTCAMALSTCNECETPFDETKEPILTPNALLAFVYGVEKSASGPGPHGLPLRFSSRYEDKDVFAFDDELGRAPFHWCIVPTTIIRTVQELLLRPDAIEILQLLEDTAHKALNKTVTKEWCQMLNVSLDRLHELLIFGINAQPSQFQLHLHCIVPPLMPEDYYLVKCGIRFTRFRFLPLGYVKECAQAIRKLPPGTIPSDFDIFTTFQKYDVSDYDKALDEETQRALKADREVGLWKDKWFTHKVIDGKVYDNDGNLCEGTPAEWARKDKLKMKNVGGPCDADGKSQPLSYLSTARKPETGTTDGGSSNDSSTDDI